MKSYHTDHYVTLHHGDALDVLRTLPDASVQAVVTDPPWYSLSRAVEQLRGQVEGIE
jgi:predicted methyltransferase